ncbi:fimbrial assembly protein [uncultured Porphyromonas sp.]|uniref:fimbrial assembly protein n=1 Tax=uncultured Porphyromonas sp. TaxID=159274 RepID=UPI00266D0F35|nr:fimbrial assembly protein [uncultured Porphyromonas sp.]
MKPYRHILTLLLALSALLLTALSGCKRSELRETLESATVQLSIPTMTLRGGELLVEDLPVQTIRILVFNQTGGALDVQQSFSTPTDLSDWLRVEAHEGAKDIYVIANESPAMSTALNKVIFKQDLLSMAIPDEDPSNAAESQPILMVGQGTATLVKDQNVQAEIDLIKTRAKITLDFKQATPADDQVIIRSVSISRLPKTSMLLTPTPYSLGDTWIYTKDGDATLVNNAAPTSYIADKTLYTYENIGSVADTTDRAPILTVQALYNGVPTTYTAYVNDATSDADHHYALHRNHHYQLTGTITKIGAHNALLLTTRVLPWEVEKTDEQLENPKIVSLSPDPKEIYYVTDTEAVEFRVKISSSSDPSKWRATLTNALDFKLVVEDGVVREGLADGTTEYTVRVIATKPAGASLRCTHLLFTSEYLDLQGSGIPAEGIKICQKHA